MQIGSALNVSVILGARRVRGHTGVLVCLGCRTGLRACISNIAADRKNGIHPVRIRISTVFPGLDFDLVLDSGVNDDSADPTTTAGLLRFFGDLARQGEVVSCAGLDGVQSAIEDLRGGCDSGAGCGGVEDHWPHCSGPVVGLGGIEWRIDRNASLEDANFGRLRFRRTWG
jgi:hypothetical protein